MCMAELRTFSATPDNNRQRMPTVLTGVESVHVIKVQVMNTIVTTQYVQLTLIRNCNSTAN